MAPESMSQMGTDACAALSQNMDFDVVVPLEHVSAEDREARDRAASFTANARERASGTDVKELAASTTSLIDTARPFFLAFFAVLFTILAFVGGDDGTSQLFVVGAILFVLAAGFSDELGHIVPAHRRQAGHKDEDHEPPTASSGT